MQKYLMMGALLLLGLSFAQPADMWTYNKYEVAYCKAELLDGFFNYMYEEYCADEGTYEDMGYLLDDVGYPDYGIIDDMFHTMDNEWECFGETTDYACIGQYRSQFRSQYNVFNSYLRQANRLIIAAGLESIDEGCIDREDFMQDYMMYSYISMGCNFGRPMVA